MTATESADYRAGPGLLNAMDLWMRELTGKLRLVTVCPCCSFAGCPHPSWDPSCPRCDRPIAPEGKWATRCPVDGKHGWPR